MAEYKLTETNGIAILSDDSGKPLMSFEKDGNNFIATYYNENIDKKNYNEYKFVPRFASEFGNVFKMSIECESEASLSQCYSRFIALATDGFTSELRGFVGIDWEDLEKICLEHPYGHWFSIAYEDNSGSAVKKLLKQIKEEYGKSFSAILCVEDGFNDMAPSMVVNIFSNEVEDVDGEIALQILINDNKNVQRIDAWVFPNV